MKMKNVYSTKEKNVSFSFSKSLSFNHKQSVYGAEKAQKKRPAQIEQENSGAFDTK